MSLPDEEGQDESYRGNGPHIVNPTLTLCQFCELCGLSICFSTQSVPLPLDKGEDSPLERILPEPKEECCRVLPPEVPCIVTHETRNHRTYVSTNVPALDRLDYATVMDGLKRTNNAHCKAGDIVMLSNNNAVGTNYSRGDRSKDIHSTVISKVFLLTDVKARGRIRKAFLLMVLSDRFTALQNIQFLQEHFVNIIQNLLSRAQQSETDCSWPTGGPSHGPLRSLGKLLQFDNFGQYLHNQ